MPNSVGDMFESPLERDLAEFDPSGVAASPPLGSGSAGGGGVRTPTTGLDDHCNPDEEKNEEGIEGGEDGRTHAHDFKRASYVAQIAPPMLLAVVVVCFPPWMRVTIRDRRSFGWEEEDKEDDGDCSQEKDDYKGTMMATNDCSGHGRCNAEGRWNQNIIAIGR